MQEHSIRRTGTNSVNSVDLENFVDVELKQHTKIFPFPNISDTIDQMEQFESERADCTKYRLILTIKPYCSNVLFNTVSEIVQNEGTIDYDKFPLRIASNEGIIESEKGTKISKLEFDSYTIRGKDTDVTNDDMIRNTEYKNGGFIYHCGYDIFNNHILRNQTFKLINPITDRSYKHKNTRGGYRKNVKNNFNTIMDIMRYSDGSEVTLKRRTDVNTIEGSRNSAQENARHMYMRDDVLTYTDSININLTEQNGWFGFYNKSMIDSCEYTSNTWNSMNISKVLNTDDKLSCSFIEMYPDSSLYSFNPKYNSFQNREEQNWEVCITYPYSNDYDKILVHGQLSNKENINALLLADYKQTKGASTQDIILFRSYVKHNLKVGDEIKLYYSEKNTEGVSGFIEIEDLLFTVANIGDLQNNSTDYYFYINNVNDVLNALKVSSLSDNYVFRFTKVVNGKNCEYYYRKFRKLPNFRLKKEELTDKIAKEQIEKYIKNNCCREYIKGNEVISYDTFISKNEEEQEGYKGKEINFQYERYPLAFSKTIYSDDITQITFTDSIDIDKLRDNLGRPITELFLTIIKNNKGHDLWYKKAKTQEDLKEIEYSHCFGDVISGLDIHGEDNDSDEIKLNRIILGDIKCLFNGILYKSTEEEENNNEQSTEEEEFLNIKKESSLSPNGITINDNIFYGDVVELNLDNLTETVLSEVYFRFNTEQREHEFTSNDIQLNDFTFDEIKTDDYDYDNFECETRSAKDINEVDGKTTIVEGIYYKNKDVTYRPEGYYYKAHYSIPVREFGELRQDIYEEISNVSSRPIQMNGLFIEVTSLTKSGVSEGDTVYLCDSKDGDILLTLMVNSVQDTNTFVLSQPFISPEEEGYLSIYNIIEGLTHSELHKITEDDVKNGYEWTDENGLRHVAKDNSYEWRYVSDAEDVTHEAYNVQKNIKNVDNNTTIEYYSWIDENYTIRTAYNVRDIGDSHYRWEDEYGNAHESILLNTIKDIDKEVYDYSKPIYTLKIKNNEISDYAYQTDNSTFVWRDILTVGNKEAANLPEYPFTNGHFYINKEINFFLKRQDPFGKNKLYAGTKLPNDIYGKIKEDSIYKYKDGKNVIC